jgi:hypothetical protein
MGKLEEGARGYNNVEIFMLKAFMCLLAQQFSYRFVAEVVKIGEI